MSQVPGNPHVPRKYILEKPQLVETFHSSPSFAKIVSYVQCCAEAVEEMSRSAWLQQRREEKHPTIAFFTDVFFPHLRSIVASIPLEDMKQQRFGNRSFRVFHSRLEENIFDLMRGLVATLNRGLGDTTERQNRGISAGEVLKEARANGNGDDPLVLELAEYMKDAFGNSVRIDYGTGHELHFFIVMLICMQECGDNGAPLQSDVPVVVPHKVQRPPPPPVEQRDALLQLRRAMVFDVFSAYLSFMRHLQHHYKLEPAGSHGVWGLDDYHHLPFVFGASQLINKEVPTATPETTTNANNNAENGSENSNGNANHELILPKHVCEADIVRRHAEEYMYFAQVLWVIENKSGPFFEHSSMLYNISGVDSWKKTYTGMVKMYAAEVLLKFNVVQHLLFGEHLPWPEQQ